MIVIRKILIKMQALYTLCETRPGRDVCHQVRIKMGNARAHARYAFCRI